MKKPVPRAARKKAPPKPPEAPVIAEVQRTARGLRDALFDEITSLRGPSPDPRRALAVASLAKQIVNTVRVELDVAKQVQLIKDKGGDVQVGTLALGSRESVSGAPRDAKVH